MALRIADYVERGWLDASEPGRLTGEIWLVNQSEPLQLDLAGYPMADLAGYLLSFENTAAVPNPDSPLLPVEQFGSAGDITASKKILDGDPNGGKDSFRTVNVLYIEWYSAASGRVVIESVHFNVRIHGAPTWRLTPEQENERQDLVANGMMEFMKTLQQSVGDDFDDDEEWTPMDEFEWERSLKESDERTEQYGALLEKYKDHPDQERLIAREMGWDELEDFLDADERGVFEEDKEAAPVDNDEEEDAEEQADEVEFFPERAPDPEREGIDWIRREDGDIRHPLAHQAFELSGRLHRAMEQAGMYDETASLRAETVHVMVFATRMLSAKLAGALNSLGYDRDLEFMAGMVVAQLKRALTHFNEAIHRMDEATQYHPDLHDTLAPFRQELFSIRESMLALMDRFRSMIN